MNTQGSLLLEPTKPFYEVVDTEFECTFNLDDRGGEALYGSEDWELALEGVHPTVTVRQIQVTIN